MKSLNYFKYWYFIGLNWNFFLATFTVYHEIKGEKKYNLESIEIDRLKTISVKGNNLDHASMASHKLKPGTLRALPPTYSPLFASTTVGLWYFSMRRLATIPTTPLCQCDW